jgi:hypothetical protein
MERDYVVVANKIDCHIPSETRVESFGPFTHEEADKFAMELSNEIKAEWMFYSQSMNNPQEVDVQTAARYLLNL